MNQHITDYLDYYRLLETSPNFAVLLRGDWGAGKTWFIKKYIKDNSDEDNNHFLYVSLYGMTTYSEINEALFQELHPILGSKKAKLATKIISGMVKTTLRIDLFGDTKEDATISSGIPKIDLPDYLLNIEEKILVFDDLERCSIPVQNILGYINQFVENQDAKVIIVANEKELFKLNASSQDLIYRNIKEKLVGKSFDIHTDIHAALADFIEECSDSEYKTSLTERNHLIVELFSISGYNNLRHLRQTILDFERFYHLLPNSAKIKPDLIDHLISLFFIFSFEIKKGGITEDDIEKFFGLSFWFLENKNNTESIISEIKNKYHIFAKSSHPISEMLWTCYFKRGIVDKAELEESLKNSEYYPNESIPKWIQLSRWTQLEDDEFEQICDEVYKDFKECRFRDKNNLIEITFRLLKLSVENYISHSKDEIMTLANANVESLKRGGELKKKLNEVFPKELIWEMQSHHQSDIPEFNIFLEHIKNESNSLFEIELPVLANDLLEAMNNSFENFRIAVTLTNSEVNYYDFPILKFIEPTKFVDGVLRLTNKDKTLIGWVLEKRYNTNNHILTEELGWLKEVNALLKSEAANRGMKISKHLLIQNIIPSIEKCINKL